MKNTIKPETWKNIIQVIITVLTVISGMFLESSTNAVASLRNNITHVEHIAMR